MAITILTPKKGDTVSLATEPQKTFLAGFETRKNLEPNQNLRWYALEREGSDFSMPAGVEITWKDDDDETDWVFRGQYQIFVSETPDMKNSWFYTSNSHSLTVFNLKIGCDYYITVQSPVYKTEPLHFQTEDLPPRWIKIPAISNIRDMGGYQVKNGRIRQGLVYRGGEFELHMDLSQDGGNELRRLGIKTELDMRGESVGHVYHPVAEVYGVSRVLIPMSAYTGFFTEEYHQNCKDFFALFTKKEAYPIYYHCWGGADRTGTGAFLLGALLGMSEEDLVTEYELTSLSIWGVRSRNFHLYLEFREKFDALPGDGITEKAENYFRDYIGFSDKEIADLREIMIEQ